jgi:excisionase family DNA binding protein
MSDRYTIADAAHRLGVSKQTILRWSQDGTINLDAVHRERSKGRFGFRIVFDAAEIERFPVSPKIQLTPDDRAALEERPIDPQPARIGRGEV